MPCLKIAKRAAGKEGAFRRRCCWDTFRWIDYSLDDAAGFMGLKRRSLMLYVMSHNVCYVKLRYGFVQGLLIVSY